MDKFKSFFMYMAILFGGLFLLWIAYALHLDDAVRPLFLLGNNLSDGISLLLGIAMITALPFIFVGIVRDSDWWSKLRKK